MRNSLFVFCIIFFLFLQKAIANPAFQPPPNGKPMLSDHAKVSVVTCSPGEEIYAIFGHTALRIQDPVHNMDRVYNYGTFQFNTPAFTIKFAGGRLLYFLSVTSYPSFAASYIADNRALSEQVLHLSKVEKQRIFDKVEENLQPEHRYYYYQFFSDNCTSRVYELIASVLGPDFQTDTTYIREQLSFRQLIRPHLEAFPWTRVGMNVGLGLEADHKTQLHERVFLPDELELALDHSRNGSMPLVKEKNFLYQPTENPVKKASLVLSPFLFLTILAMLVSGFSYYEYRNGLHLLWLDRLVFGFTGFLGLVLLLLWLFSAHTPTHQNLNILWLNPLNLLLVGGSRKIKSLQQSFAKGGLVLILSLMVLNLFQPLFIPEFYPVAIVLAIRFLSRSGLLGATKVYSGT